MPDLEQAFLADIVASPSDDAPRLIFADLLLDRNRPGDREQAGFIQTKYPPTWIEEGPLRPWRQYARRLLAPVVRKSWAAWIVNGPGNPQWDRDNQQGTTWAVRWGGVVFHSSAEFPVICLRHGFVGCISATWKQYQSMAGWLFASQPIEAATLAGVYASPMGDGEFSLERGRVSGRIPYGCVPLAIYDLLQGGRKEVPISRLSHSVPSRARIYRCRQDAYEGVYPVYPVYPMVS